MEHHTGFVVNSPNSFQIFVNTSIYVLWTSRENSILYVLSKVSLSLWKLINYLIIEKQSKCSSTYWWLWISRSFVRPYNLMFLYSCFRLTDPCDPPIFTLSTNSGSTGKILKLFKPTQKFTLLISPSKLINPNKISFCRSFGIYPYENEEKKLFLSYFVHRVRRSIRVTNGSIIRNDYIKVFCSCK